MAKETRFNTGTDFVDFSKVSVETTKTPILMEKVQRFLDGKVSLDEALKEYEFELNRLGIPMSGV